MKIIFVLDSNVLRGSNKEFKVSTNLMSILNELKAEKINFDVFVPHQVEREIKSGRYAGYKAFKDKFKVKLIENDIKKVDYEHIFDKAIGKIAPFRDINGSSDKGFKDAVIWQNLVKEFSKKRYLYGDIYFITNDDGFVKGADELKKDLKGKNNSFSFISVKDISLSLRRKIGLSTVSLEEQILVEEIINLNRGVILLPCIEEREEYFSNLPLRSNSTNLILHREFLTESSYAIYNPFDLSYFDGATNRPPQKKVNCNKSSDISYANFNSNNLKRVYADNYGCSIRDIEVQHNEQDKYLVSVDINYSVFGIFLKPDPGIKTSMLRNEINGVYLLEQCIKTYSCIVDVTRKKILPQ